MGSFAGYFGECRIPEEKKPELKERMLTLLTEGGMMHVGVVEMFGHRLGLLTLPAYDEDDMVDVGYNYFEDDRWESAGYNAKKGRFWSNKVGSSKFAVVVSAAYVLLEFYSDTHMIAEYNGAVYNEVPSIGWLNQLFNESYTNERAVDLWKVYRMIPEYARNKDLTYLRLGTEDEYMEIDSLIYMCVTNLDRYDEIIAKMPEKEDDGTTSVCDWIAVARRELRKIKAMDTETEEEKLWRLKATLTTPVPDVWNLELQEVYKSFGLAAKLIPYEISLKFIADAFNLDYWTLLEEVEPLVTDRESIYAELYGPSVLKPIPAVSTTDFLRTTDENRLFFWTPDGDVNISEETAAWFTELRQEFDGIMSGEGQLIEPKQFLPELMRTLHRVCDDYRRIYFFEDLFNEFAISGNDRCVQAAVILLQRLMERYKDEIEGLGKAYWPFDLQKPGRLTIKRYIALLANSELRQRVLGF